MTLAEIAGAAYIPLNLPEGMEPGLEETAFYDPENFVFPFGAHACVVDVDPETGQGQGRALRRGRRLRPGDQPDAHRRPGPRRHRAGDRPGAVRAGRLRRRRPARDRHVRRLRAADRERDPVVRDRPHRDAVADEHARRQGRRRGRHDRRHARRSTNAVIDALRPLGVDVHRHAADADAHLAGDPHRRRARRRPSRARTSGSTGRAPPAPDPPARPREVRSDPARVRLHRCRSRSTTRSRRSPTAARTRRSSPAATRCCR